MKKLSVIPLLLSVTLLGGCQTLPWESGHHISWQRPVVSVYHIELHAQDVAKQLKQELLSRRLDAKDVAIAIDLRNTPFQQVYIDKLQYALIDKGFNVVSHNAHVVIQTYATPIEHVGNGFELEFFGSRSDDATPWGELVLNSKIFFENESVAMRSDNYYIPTNQIPQYKFK